MSKQFLYTDLASIIVPSEINESAFSSEEYKRPIEIITNSLPTISACVN